MIITAKVGAYSSVVGGSVDFRDDQGIFMGSLLFMCQDGRLRDKTTQQQLAAKIAAALNGVEI